MQDSLEGFLEQVARRGSWIGGGSAAAFSAALSAALLEKVSTEASSRGPLRRARQECLRLVERDAAVFSRVIQATRAKRPAVFRTALKEATEVPCRIVAHAAALQQACQLAQRRVKPRFQSDLRCARALARAAMASAEALIATNLTWLNDRGYAAAVRRHVRAASRVSRRAPPD